MNSPPRKAGPRQETNVGHLLIFLIKKPHNALVVAGKIIKHFFDRRRRFDEADYRRWMSEHSRSSDSIARATDPTLWDEAIAFETDFRVRSSAILETVPFRIGGGGAFTFLYWLVRKLRPETVLETGVAAGWSSQAMLAAMDRNGRGQLYSSDFPYFRVPNPERYIGILVEYDRRARWHLSIKGDQVALPEFIGALERIDIFHYDSDKSYQGREFAMALVTEKMSREGLVLIDDIVDNSWFRDYVERRRIPFMILDERVGVIGNLALLDARS